MTEQFPSAIRHWQLGPKVRLTWPQGWFPYGCNDLPSKHRVALHCHLHESVICLRPAAKLAGALAIAINERWLSEAWLSNSDLVVCWLRYCLSVRVFGMSSSSTTSINH